METPASQRLSDELVSCKSVKRVTQVRVSFPSFVRPCDVVFVRVPAPAVSCLPSCKMLRDLSFIYLQNKKRNVLRKKKGGGVWTW
jgi:hypothetical protein